MFGMIQRTIWKCRCVNFNPLKTGFLLLFFKEIRACWQHYEKTDERILLKFSGTVAHETRNNLKHFRDVTDWRLLVSLWKNGEQILRHEQHIPRIPYIICLWRTFHANFYICLFYLSPIFYLSFFVFAMIFYRHIYFFSILISFKVH